MGTRSLTIIRQSDQTEIVTMYRQFDGYPSGHGQELAEFLGPLTVLNGFNIQDPATHVNGDGCLAARIVAHFKNQSMLGGIYLHPAGTADCGEEYVYECWAKDGRVWLVCRSGSRTGPILFEGWAADFDVARAEEVENAILT